MNLIENLNGCFPDLINKWKLLFHLDWTCSWTLSITIGSYLLEKLLIGFLVSTSIARSFCLQATFIHCMSFWPFNILYLYQTLNINLRLYFAVISKCVITWFIGWQTWVMEIITQKKEHHPNSFNNHISLVFLHCCCTTVKASET